MDRLRSRGQGLSIQQARIKLCDGDGSLWQL